MRNPCKKSPFQKIHYSSRKHPAQQSWARRTRGAAKFISRDKLIAPAQRRLMREGIAGARRPLGGIFASERWKKSRAKWSSDGPFPFSSRALCWVIHSQQPVRPFDRFFSPEARVGTWEVWEIHVFFRLWNVLRPDRLFVRHDDRSFSKRDVRFRGSNFVVIVIADFGRKKKMVARSCMGG